jgi:ribosomal protein S18 acetylase RimI-like enzyme
VTSLRIAPLSSTHASISLGLLDQAFANDPSLGWYLFSQRAGYAQRRRDYLAGYLHFHQINNLPALGAWRDGELLGLSCFSSGSEITDSASLDALGQHISQCCGDDCLARLDQLLAAFDQRLPRPDLARIEFIAVAPGHQGQGIGSALLSATLTQLRNHGAPGAALETSEARNLALYQRHGFQAAATLALPGLLQHYLQQTWI